MLGKSRGELGVVSVFYVLSLKWIIFSSRPPAPIWQCPGNFKLHTESY